MGPTEIVLAAILGVLVITLATALAPRLGIAGPLALVIIGIGVSLLPFVPPIEVDPELILVGVLPPLLYSAAVSMPAIEFRRDFRPIAGLSVLLVVVSAVVLALFFQAVIPSLDFFLALALGAILSPTDAVATSIVKRLGISRRVVTLLEGESLLNDATSLVILRTAVAAAAIGASATTTVEAPDFVGSFLWGVLVALVVGGIIGWLNLRLRAALSHSAAGTAIGFIVPFAAYLPTEELGGSGLVAAVVAGIVTGQGSARWFTPEQRLSNELNWRTIELVLEGAVFLLMGLELKEILLDLRESPQGIGQGVGLAAVALVIILAVRSVYVAFLLWLQGRRARRRGRRRERLDDAQQRLDAAAERPPRLSRTDPEVRQSRIAAARARVSRMMADLDYYQATPLGWKHGTVIVWAGMRGVVTLAAAQTLPRDSPDRALLVFVAFAVAVGSLMLQGFTFRALVRMLRLNDSAQDAITHEEQTRIDDALRLAAASALQEPGLRRRDGSPFPEHLVERVGRRLTEPPDDDTTALARDLLELRMALIEAMRARLEELSHGGEYSTAALRHALAELDADELSLQLRLDGE